MKKTILLFMALLGLLLSSEQQFAQTIWSLDFETAGGYTTSVPEFTDGSSDYFIRTDGTDFGSWVVYNGAIGTYYFAGMDLDGEGATLPLFLDINDIDITGQTTLQFRVYLAEDDDGTNQDWDDPDYVHFGYDIDNSGSFTPMLWIEGAGGTNAAPHIDTNFDGTGDGTEITDNFVQFFVPISVSGSLMDIQIEFNLNSGDEDIAIDHLELVAGGGPLPLDANFSADQTSILTGSTVNFTDFTSGGTLPYSYEWDLDGDGAFDDAFVANPSFMYNTAGTYDIALRVTDDDTSVDTETKIGYITVITPIEVANLAALRAGIQGEVYKVTGEVFLTFQQDFRNQKYIQDGTAAILIDDDIGIITTPYVLNDGITGIIGTLGEYGFMMQFAPFTNSGAATSNGNIITPQIITLDDLAVSFEDYEAELIQLLDVTFSDAGGTFEVVPTAQVYSISDASAIGNFRTTFYDVDYIGTTIPATADIVVLPNSRTDGNYVTSRSLADFTIESNDPTQLAITEVNGGTNPYVNNDFSVVVQAQDAGGAPAIVTGDVNFSFTTNDPFSVDFTGLSIMGGIIASGTSQVTVTGVQMAPTGTGVTITANDDITFNGLISGTSASFDVVELIIPDLIITEVMQNPDSVGDTAGEWFEVYNNSATPIDMTGWIMEDLGSNTHTIAGPLTVPAFGFAILGNNVDVLTNGGYTCNYEYPSTFSLANGDDEIILYLPDGVTEIDRIEWDGGPIWPDPTGASMVYTGIASEENNNGTLWSTATQVELSYPDPACDYGSPGSNGADQVLTEGFSLDLNVLLEGFYNPVNDSMNNYFRQNSLLPYLQPFMVGTPYYGNSTPVWNYSGMEISPSIPYSTTTDWILLEIRDGISGPGTFIPAFVEVDGQVCSFNGSARISIKSTFTNNMYIVVYHMNHLAIMSANGINPVTGTVVSYDYSTGSDKVYGGTAGYKEIEAGVWGMVAGDINADGTIDQLDNTDGWSTEAGEEGAYQGSNLYIDGQINNLDKNELWAPNVNTSSQVPN